MSRSQTYAALAIVIALLFVGYVYFVAGGSEIAEGGDPEDAATNPDADLADPETAEEVADESPADDTDG